MSVNFFLAVSARAMQRTLLVDPPATSEPERGGQEPIAGTVISVPAALCLAQLIAGYASKPISATADGPPHIVPDFLRRADVLIEFRGNQTVVSMPGPHKGGARVPPINGGRGLVCDENGVTVDRWHWR